MSYIWSLTKSITKTFTGSTEFFTISSKDEKNINTISIDDKGKLTKSKSVTFGEIEIIDVESYKKYNELDELSLENNEIGCMKRCGIYCQCNLF